MAEKGVQLMEAESGGLVIKTEDGSVLSPAGKVLFFSCTRFARDIGEGDCCFVCGASSREVLFNDEHVLPQWLLREFGLFNKSITLSNDKPLSYGQFVVPCCITCNRDLGRLVEEPARALLLGGYDRVCEHLAIEGPGLLFTWLALVFLKTHLKDRSLRFHVDLRKPPGAIADAYDWGELHHVHCVARSIVTGSTMDPSALGSLLVCPVDSTGDPDPFSFLDLYHSKTIMIRLRDLALIAVLDDAGGVMSAIRKSVLSRIEWPVTLIELHELAARFAYMNLALAKRPHHYTDFSGRVPVMRADVPATVELQPHVPEVWGKLLHHCTHHFYGRLTTTNVSDIREQVLAGRWTFLLELGDARSGIVPHMPTDTPGSDPT